MEGLLALVQHKEYQYVIHQCQEIETDVLLSNPNHPFYAIYLLSYLIQNELPSARALYSRIPPQIQETPSIRFLHSLLQRAWNTDYKGFYTLVSEVETGLVQLDEPLHSAVLDYKRIWQERTLTLLTKAYTSIPPEKAAEYLGLSNDVVIPVLQQEKWTYDAQKNLLMPGKLWLQRKAVDQRAEFADFARLTEIAMVLKGR